MQLTATGIGSGLDVKNLVEQLVTAERGPESNRLNLREARTNAELSALGKFKSALASFQDSLDALSDLSKFQQRTASVSDDTLIGATATSAAVPGTYRVEVTALASRHKLASAAFTDSSTAVGDGILSISVGAKTANVAISSTANTLADIRDAINNASDNPGVVASIVNGADGAHLILSASETGAANAISISSSGGNGGLAQLNYDPATGGNPMTELQPASDASIVVDGFSVTSPSNSVDGAIEGVSIDLLRAAPGTVADLSVSLDEPAAKAAVGAFVNAYNGLMATIREVTNFNADTGEAAPLLGDATVRGIRNALRRELGSAFDIAGASFRTLADIGITTQANGDLQLDDARLSAAITQNFDGVGQLFADTQGIVAGLQGRLDSALGDTGSIGLRETRLKDLLTNIGDARDRLDQRMERVRKRLLDQFNAMDRLIASLQNTSSFLTRQLG